MRVFEIILAVILGQFVLGYVISLFRNWNAPVVKTLQQVTTLMKTVAGEGYVHRVLVAFDIFVNVICGGCPDETISSHVRRVSDAHPGASWNPIVWVAKVLNGWLDVISHDHGQHAEAGDLERAEAVEQIEDKSLGVKL